MTRSIIFTFVKKYVDRLDISWKSKSSGSIRTFQRKKGIRMQSVASYNLWKMGCLHQTFPAERVLPILQTHLDRGLKTCSSVLVSYCTPYTLSNTRLKKTFNISFLNVEASLPFPSLNNIFTTSASFLTKKMYLHILPRNSVTHRDAAHL